MSKLRNAHVSQSCLSNPNACLLPFPGSFANKWMSHSCHGPWEYFHWQYRCSGVFCNQSLPFTLSLLEQPCLWLDYLLPGICSARELLKRVKRNKVGQEGQHMNLAGEEKKGFRQCQHHHKMPLPLAQTPALVNTRCLTPLLSLVTHSYASQTWETPVTLLKLRSLGPLSSSSIP